jgi:hypothetical protein
MTSKGRISVCTHLNLTDTLNCIYIQPTTWIAELICTDNFPLFRILVDLPDGRANSMRQNETKQVDNCRHRYAYSMIDKRNLYSHRSKISTVYDFYNDAYTVYGRSVVSMDVWFKIDVPCLAQR